MNTLQANSLICSLPDDTSQGVTIGIGLEWGVLVAVNAEAFSCQELWTAAEYGSCGLQPTFTGILARFHNQATIADLNTAGLVLAIQPLHLGHAEIIDSWFLAALMLGPSVFEKVSFSVIQQVDPALAAAVEPWTEFNYNNTSTTVSSQLQSLFISIFGMTVSIGISY